MSIIVITLTSLWAELRNSGVPTADVKNIDVDCILAVQALVEGRDGEQVVIATTNVGHLSRIPNIDARLWTDIV
jgi:hypothetical protein